MGEFMISILIPVYNTESWLSRCLESVIHQTYTDLEIFCLNDGSTDNSMSLLQDYARKDDRIRIYSRENRGLASTRNDLMNMSKGEYVFFLDSDDYIDPKTIEVMVCEAKDKDAQIVQCGFSMDYRFGKLLRAYSGHKCFNTLEALQNLAKSHYLNNYAWGKLIHRSCLEGIRFPDGKLFEDTFTTFKLVENAERTATVPNRFYHYVQRRGSIANRMSLEKVYTIRHAYEYQDRYLRSHYPLQTFSFDHNYYYADMVIIYTLIVFCHRKEHPLFIPADINWKKINFFYKIAYLVWLSLAVIKLGPSILQSRKKPEIKEDPDYEYLQTDTLADTELPYL